MAAPDDLIIAAAPRHNKNDLTSAYMHFRALGGKRDVCLVIACDGKLGGKHTTCTIPIEDVGKVIAWLQAAKAHSENPFAHLDNAPTT